jgi:hypothetical protein
MIGRLEHLMDHNRPATSVSHVVSDGSQAWVENVRLSVHHQPTNRPNVNRQKCRPAD